MKYNHEVDKTKEILAIQKIVRAYINKAQYKNAFKYLTKISKKFPNSYYIASLLATLNTEDAWVLPAKKKDQAFSEAARKLKELLKYSRGASASQINRNKNEYYWFVQLHKKQYEFGVSLYKKGIKNGLYSQGVGSVNYAYKLMSEGKLKIGLKWAQKSEKIWEEYFLKVGKDYHDPWYWYAFSLGIQGRKEQYEKAIKNSAKLAKKNVKANLAFKKLRKLVKEAL